MEIWEFFHTDGRSLTNKLDKWKLRMAANMAEGSYSLLITETWLHPGSQQAVRQRRATGSQSQPVERHRRS